MFIKIIYLFVLLIPFIFRLDIQRIDIDSPLWDQSTFIGRFKHFAWVTDFRTCFVSESELDDAKKLVNLYRYELAFVLFIKVNLNLCLTQKQHHELLKCFKDVTMLNSSLKYINHLLSSKLFC